MKSDAFVAGHQQRSFGCRASADTNDRIVRGIAVPWDERIELAQGIFEEIAPGAVSECDGMLFWRHDEPVGIITDHHTTDTGWEIESRVSETSLGNDALTLVADGAVKSFSIGFYPIEYERTEENNSTIIRHTKIRVAEVSIVPIPAYPGAKISREKEHIMSENNNSDDIARALTEMREHLVDHDRAIALMHAPAAPIAPDTRSLASIVRAISSGDTATIEEINTLYSRDFTGIGIAEGIDKPGWVGDLSRIVANANPLMGMFSTGALPATGSTIEFGELKTNTVKVEKQAKEGDTLATGSISFKIRSAEIHTYGGYVRLSQQAIERSTNSVLDAALRAQALAAGVALADAFQAHVTAAIGEQADNKIVVADMKDWKAWFAGIIDAHDKLKKLGLPLTGLLMDKATFIGIGTLADSTGRPIMDLNGDGTNTIGNINVPVGARMLSVPVFCNTQAPAGQVAFFNNTAIRSYTSPVARLQNSNVINLSQDFSIYQYAAFADEIPAALIPVASA